MKFTDKSVSSNGLNFILFIIIIVVILLVDTKPVEEIKANPKASSSEVYFDAIDNIWQSFLDSVSRLLKPAIDEKENKNSTEAANNASSLSKANKSADSAKLIATKFIAKKYIVPILDKTNEATKMTKIITSVPPLLTAATPKTDVGSEDVVPTAYLVVAVIVGVMLLIIVSNLFYCLRHQLSIRYLIHETRQNRQHEFDDEVFFTSSLKY